MLLFDKVLEIGGYSPSAIPNLAVTGDGEVFEIPAGVMLEFLIFHETAGDDITVDIGTTAGADDVAAAIPVSGTRVLELNKLFSMVASQKIYISSAAWGTSSLNVYALIRADY